MESKILINSIAYCGLVCKLCFRAQGCDGCKTANNKCERDLSDQGCFQKECCKKNGYTGCWECNDLDSCAQGIYSDGEYSKVKAFTLYMQLHGVETFIQAVTGNIQKGLNIEKGKDFDGLKIEKVHEMLNSVL